MWRLPHSGRDRAGGLRTGWILQSEGSLGVELALGLRWLREKQDRGGS